MDDAVVMKPMVTGQVIDARDAVAALADHFVERLTPMEAISLYDLLAQQFGDSADDLAGIDDVDPGDPGA